jgi:hypothetical protein
MQNTKELRARSLPSTRRYYAAVICSIVHFATLAITVTALVLLLSSPSHLKLIMTLGALAGSVATWLLAHLQRKSAFCPLCKGTPLANTGAHPHRSAQRLPPFNEGVTAVLAIIATQKFRCMYCGSNFDLLKPSRHQGH